MNEIILFETARLLAVELQAHHGKPMKNMVNDPKNADAFYHLDMTDDVVVEAIEAWKRDQLESRDVRRIYRMGVLNKETMDFIGYVTAIMAAQEPGITALPEIGFVIKSNICGRGYGTEIARGSAAMAFDRFANLSDEIIATCDTDNVASIKILTSLGFSQKSHNIQKSF